MRAPSLVLVTGLVGAALACTDAAPDERAGRLQRIIEDRFQGRPDRGESRLELVLTTPAGEELSLHGDPALAALPTGAWLRVRGILGAVDHAEPGVRAPFEVASFESDHDPIANLAQPLVVDPAAPPAPRKLAVILFNFQNDDRQPISVDEARRKIFGDTSSVRAFHKEQSYGFVDLGGKLDRRGGDVFGWYTIPANNRPCLESRWDDLALAMAAEQGIDTAGYDHYVYVFPYSDACGYGGRGEQPGRNTWINGASISVMNHELGHNFGTPHASTLVCTNAAGERVTLGGSCRTVEYGNPFDVMGHGHKHTNAFNKARARWLGGSNIESVARDGVYTLLPQERPSTGVQLLSTVYSETQAFYVEYRQPFGYDDFPAESAAVTGVIVMLGGGLRTLTNSFLLDTNPATTTFADAPLGVGKTFTDPRGDVKITLVERTAEAAKVRFEFRGGANGGMLREPDAGARDGGARPDGSAEAGPRDVGARDVGSGETAADADARGPDGVAMDATSADAQPSAAGGASGAGTGGNLGAGGTLGTGNSGTGGAPGGTGGRATGGRAGAAGAPAAEAATPREGGGCAMGGRGRPALPLFVLAFLPFLPWVRRVRRAGARVLRGPDLTLLLALAAGVAAAASCQPEEPIRDEPPPATTGPGTGGKRGPASGGQPGTSVADAATAAEPSGARDDRDAGPADTPDPMRTPDAPPASGDGGTVSRLVVPTAPADVAAACARYAEAYCARVDACIPDGIRWNFGELAFCKARREQACRLDLQTPGRAETITTRQTCTDAIAAQPCRDFYFGRPLPACDFPPGTLAMGAPCHRTSQCAAGLSCEIETDEVCGVCSPTLPVGGDCAFWTGGCPVGTACYADQCLAPLGPGAACKRTAASCVGGLACTNEGCVEKNGDVGATCLPNDICDPLKNVYCDLMSGKCAANPPAVEVGKPCNVVDATGARSRCAAGATCFSPPASPTRRICVARVGPGASCDNATGPVCAPPAECVRGTCVVPTIVSGPPTIRMCK